MPHGFARPSSGFFGYLNKNASAASRYTTRHLFVAHYRDQPPINPPPGTGLRRLIETRQVTQVSDMTTIRPYIERDPFVVASVELGGYRGVLTGRC
jgi:hypothetical protein